MTHQEWCIVQLSEVPCERRGIGTGSTDFRDFSCIMPAVHPYVLGAAGTSHGSDYYINDPEKTCVISATWQMMILHELLKDNAEKVLEIIENYQPKFASKEAYFASVDRLDSDGERIHLPVHRHHFLRLIGLRKMHSIAISVVGKMNMRWYRRQARLFVMIGKL